MVCPNQCSTQADVCHRFLTGLQPVWLALCSTAYKLQLPWTSPCEMCFCKESVTPCLSPASLGQWCCSAFLPGTVNFLRTPLLSQGRGLRSSKMLCEDASCWLKKLLALLLAVTHNFLEEMGSRWTIYISFPGIYIWKKNVKKGKWGYRASKLHKMYL